MMKTNKVYLFRWLMLLGQLFIFTWLISGAHEKSHYLVADAFNNAGSVTFTFWGGHFNYDHPPTMTEDIIVGLMGGLIVAVLFGILWWISHQQSKENPSELDTTTIFLIIAVMELVY